MGTAFSEIITGCMRFVDDIRWQEQLQKDPAQFFRAKSAYLISAIPKFNRPPNIQSILGYTGPSYADYSETSAAEVGETIVFNTGKTGYELCSVVDYEEESNGTPILTPHGCEYDAETGDVTVYDPVPNKLFLVDFYTDGKFDNELNDIQKRILAKCMAVDWYYQFAGAYLGVANLVTDKSFSLKSPSEHIKANTDRLDHLNRELYSEMIAYEQQLYTTQQLGNNLPRV